MIVLDTNVLSETLKPSPSGVVMQWFAVQDPGAIYITTITQAEVLYGVEILPAGKRRTSLYRAIGNLFAAEFRGRILPFDEDAARVYPKIVASRQALGRPISQFDAVIASICKSCDATIATRNLADFEHCGVPVINPWASR
jgi:toxin FitB